MEINVDLTNIPDQSDLPEGEYLCSVKSIEMKDSKRTPGNKNLDVQYTVMSSIADPGNEEVRNRILFDTISLSQAALWRVRDWIQACGVFPGPQGFKTEEVIGAQVIVGTILEQRMQQDTTTGQYVPVPGKKRSKVTGYRSAA